MESKAFERILAGGFFEWLMVGRMGPRRFLRQWLTTIIRIRYPASLVALSPEWILRQLKFVMRVSILALIILTGLRQQLIAQGEQEFRIGYGFLSDVQIMTAFAETVSTISSGIAGDPQTSNYSSLGPFVAGYKFFVSRKIAIGPELNFVRLKRTEKYLSGEVIHDRFLFANVSARLDVRYANRERIEMYGSICLGPSYIFDQSGGTAEDRSGIFLTYQLTFFGVRFGREWGGYAEIGFGRNGLLNVGISKKILK